MRSLRIPDGDGLRPEAPVSPALRLHVPPDESAGDDDAAGLPSIDAGADVALPQEAFRAKIARWARQGINIWEREGCGAAIESALFKITGWRRPGSAGSASYEKWIARNEPDNEALRLQKLTTFSVRPRISLVTPTYNTPLPFLEAMLRSVSCQTYGNWELCIADGGSDDQQLRGFLESYTRSDARIKVRFLGANCGIAENSNAAISLATGDYVAFLDHDDTLAPFALYEIARAVNRHPGADFLYSDEDKIDALEERRWDPFFKPAWSPDLLRACNYITHLTVVSRRLLDRVGCFRPGFEGSQDYDLILRATEKARSIVHIARVLYHWRMHEGSVSTHCEAKLYAYESARKALREHLARRGQAGTVRFGKSLGTYEITYALPRRPLVSIIIPSRDQLEALRRCLRSIWRTEYSPYEVIVVENDSRESNTHAYYATLAQLSNVKVVRFQGAFNYPAAVKLGVSRSCGEVILQLDNDAEAINFDWLERMLEHALRPEVGAVGAKLYFPDNRVQHAGVIIGIGGAAGHSHSGGPRESFGNAGRLHVTQNVSAVSGACLMSRREVFDEVGGPDEAFPLSFNDVDYCLKLRERGYLNVWTPLAELYHVESLTRKTYGRPSNDPLRRKELRRFHEKWKHVLSAGDPYYNPNLSLRSTSFELPPVAPGSERRAA